MAANVSASIATIFQVAKRSIACLTTLDLGVGGRDSASALGSRRFLHGFAFGANLGDGRAQHSAADIGRDFDFELVVVDDFRHLADESAGRDHRVAPADVLELILLLLLAALLRANDDKVNDADDHQHRNDLGEQVRQRGRGVRGAGLLRGGCRRFLASAPCAIGAAAGAGAAGAFTAGGFVRSAPWLLGSVSFAISL